MPLGMCYAPLGRSRGGGQKEYRRVHTRSLDTPSAMPRPWAVMTEMSSRRLRPFYAVVPKHHVYACV